MVQAKRVKVVARLKDFSDRRRPVGPTHVQALIFIVVYLLPLCRSPASPGDGWLAPIAWP